MRIRLDAEVRSIAFASHRHDHLRRRGATRTGPVGRVTGLHLRDEWLPADIVVANVDAEHLYGDLLPDAARAAPGRGGPSRRRVAFVMLAGVRGTTPGIGHHNVWFCARLRGEFAQLAGGQVPADPTIYACVSSVTDPSQAPPGDENWFLLVNVPAGADVDREA